MTIPCVRRLLGVAFAAASLGACSSTTSVPVSSVATRHGNSIASAWAPFTLTDFRGAPAPYFAALRAAGLLPKPTSTKAWLDRPAFDAVFAARRRDVSSTSRPHYVVYASSNADTIDIYQSNTYEPQHPNQAIIGQIPDQGSVAGMAVDRNQNLYVNQNNGNILEYTVASMPNSTRQVNDAYQPQGITVGPDGTIYAANFEADASGNVGIAVIPPGASSPTRTLSDPSIQHTYYDAVDIKGNVYLTYFSSAGLSLGVFPAGSSKLTPIPVTDGPYMVELDAHGNLLLANPNTASIDTVQNGTTTVTNSLPIASQSQFFIFDQTYARDQVFVNPYGPNSSGGPLLQFTYPQGVQIDTITHGTYEFALVTAPAAPLPSAYTVPVAGSSTPSPVASPTQGPCSNGTTGPLPDPNNNQLTFGGGTSCVGPNANSEQISTTATLFNANDNQAIDSFSFGATGPSDAKKITISCPGYGSYYVVVTSNVAPANKTSTVTSSGC